MALFAALVSIFVAAALPVAAGSVAVHVVLDISECPSSREVQSALRQSLDQGDQASSSGLPGAGSGARVVMAVGAGLGAALPLSKRWRIGLELEAVRVAIAPDTYVDLNGTRNTVLTPSPWQGMASAKLEFVPCP